MTELHIVMPHFDGTQYVDGSIGQASDTFIYVINGSVTLNTPVKSVHARRGEVMFIPEGLKYHAVWRDEVGCDYYSLRIISEKVDIFDTKSSFSLQLIDTSGISDVGARFDEIYRLMSKETRVDALRALSVYYGLYADILPRLQNESSPKYSPALLAATHYIDEHFAKEFSIDTLAASCHISPSRLHHIFSSQLGTTPTKYRNALRVGHAASDLRIGNLTIDEIAEKNGFNSAAYFREIFKAETGLTPTEYRCASRYSEM